MKSRTRSRRASTWGLGLKSISGVLSSGLVGPKATGLRPPVAGEELAVLLQQPGQLERLDAGQIALEDARGAAAAQLRRDRQEQLIDQA